MSELRIGKTNFEAQSKFAKRKDHKVGDGSNLFRILPPLHSLSDEGKYFKYWRIHWGFTTTDGSPRPIVCTERKSRDGVVYEHCPICDMVNAAKQELEHMKANGATAEQVEQFDKARINPYEARGHYYTYAFDGSNQLGLLKLTKTMKDGFEARGKELEAEGFDITGIKGVYIDIKKTGQGRFSTKYEVHTAMEIDPNGGPGSKRYKFHTLTPELQAVILKETQDLVSIYKPMSVEEMALLANEEDPHVRAAMVDRLFARKETTEKSGYAQTTDVKVPGQPATFVAKTEVNPTTQRLETKAPDMRNLDQGSVDSPAPVNSMTESSRSKEASPTPTDIANMSDDAFMAAFQQRFKK